ncbi:MAG: hypothetical protein ACXW11_02355 [Methylotenera sp.]
MSKLFKLKEWLILSDAAKHLSIAFGEVVSEADVLRLALDGHLKLSVNFVNHTRARRGKVVSWMETEWTITPCLNRKAIREIEEKHKNSLSDKPVREYPPSLLEVMGEISEDEKDDFSPCMCGLNIDGERFINLEKNVISISDVWDLPMIGTERLDVEHLYQQFTGGPEVTLQGLDGAFVERAGGVICQLQADFEENEYSVGSKAHLRKLGEHIVIKKIKSVEAAKLLGKYKQDRKVFLERRPNGNDANNYYPAGGLPQDAVIVVRTAALREFEQAVNGVPEVVEKPLGAKERNSLLTIIAALCDYSAIDLNGRETVAQIERMTDEIATPVGNDTIRTAIKQIPGALESRKK